MNNLTIASIDGVYKAPNTTPPSPANNTTDPLPSSSINGPPKPDTTITLAATGGASEGSLSSTFADSSAVA